MSLSWASVLIRLPAPAKQSRNSGKQVQFEIDSQSDDSIAGAQHLIRQSSMLHLAPDDDPRIVSQQLVQHDEASDTVIEYGRHGDINPCNILWYDDTEKPGGILRGTLKLADFGQAELNSRKSRTSLRDVANTLTYRPPECDQYEGHSNLPIRQTYDIWCLGCVLLEFVAWMLGGSELVDKFADRRSAKDPDPQHPYKTDIFFQVTENFEGGHLEVTVKDAVIEVCTLSTYTIGMR